MKSKVIKVDYRKESESFPDWMKYEVTLLNEDGSEELIPAYGKDLQHALSRVVKGRRVEVIKHKTEKIPMEVWVLLVLMYSTVTSILATSNNNPLWVVLGLAGLGIMLYAVRLLLMRGK
jgi:hypothetical protein